MLTKEFYLLTESSVICSYLVSKWINNLAELPNFRGFLLKEDMPSENLIQKRKLFHGEYAGKKLLTDEDYQKLICLYPALDETEKAMISLFGVSQYSTTEYAKTFFLGNDVNQEYAKNFLKENSKVSPPYIFACLTQILQPWWLEITNSQLFNVHSAVLPYARGMYSIENIAILRDINKFKKVVGFTIHYIDKGVDLGPIIRAERIIDPFRFNSIWELKGYIYMIEFDAYVKTAKEIISNNQTMPVGVIQNPSLRGPNFRIKNFAYDKLRQAEEGYLAMKNAFN
ncbi:MAG: hypothetical protein F6K36_27970 [Symploca sp. SIO3C6]|nr:hypothetical protein [Symploca sp. SIO3C6]